MASGDSIKLISVFFWHSLIIFWALSYLLAQDFPGSPCSISGSSLKSAFSPRILSSFCWKMVFRNPDFGARYAHYHWEVYTPMPSPRYSFIFTYKIHTHTQTHPYTYFITCIYIENHEFTLISPTSIKYQKFILVFSLYICNHFLTEIWVTQYIYILIIYSCF